MTEFSIEEKNCHNLNWYLARCFIFSILYQKKVSGGKITRQTAVPKSPLTLQPCCHLGHSGFQLALCFCFQPIDYGRPTVRPYSGKACKLGDFIFLFRCTNQELCSRVEFSRHAFNLVGDVYGRMMSFQTISGKFHLQSTLKK